jgi:hypothetical protein
MLLPHARHRVCDRALVGSAQERAVKVANPNDSPPGEVAVGHIKGVEHLPGL